MNFERSAVLNYNIKPKLHDLDRNELENDVKLPINNI